MSFMICILQQIVLGLPIKPDEIAWAYRMHEEEDKYKILVTIWTKGTNKMT
jgi:hypothetical protein